MLGVLGRARGVFRISDARKKVCWRFLGVLAAFFELHARNKVCQGFLGAPAAFFRASDTSKKGCWGISAFLGRTTHQEQLLARKIESSPGSGASLTCPGLSGASSENGGPRGQL